MSDQDEHLEQELREQNAENNKKRQIEVSQVKKKILKLRSALNSGDAERTSRILKELKVLSPEDYKEMAFTDENGDIVLHDTIQLALKKGIIESASHLLDMLRNLPPKHCKMVVSAADKDGNNLLQVAILHAWNWGNSKLRNFLKNFNFYYDDAVEHKNEDEESALMMLLRRETDAVVAGVENSDLINHIKLFCKVTLSSTESQDLLPSIQNEDMLEFPEESREMLHAMSSGWNIHEFFILHSARRDQWFDIEIIAKALPHHENMGPLLMKLLEVDSSDESILQHMFKQGAMAAIKSLLGKVCTVTRLKEILISSYWMMRFQDIEMSQDAIKTLNCHNVSTERYLIPKPGTTAEMSRPLAMIFYNHFKGESRIKTQQKPLKTEEEATTLKEAFKALGWPDCSIKCKDPEWTFDRLKDDIRDQLTPVVQVNESAAVATSTAGLSAAAVLVDDPAAAVNASNNAPDYASNAGPAVAPDLGTVNASDVDLHTDNTNCSLFIVCITSHGCAGEITPRSGQAGKINKILTLLDELLPPYIPRVVIVDVCRSADLELEHEFDFWMWKYAWKYTWKNFWPETITEITRPNTVLLQGTVRGQDSYEMVYLKYLAEEITKGNDYLHNMHFRASQKCFRHLLVPHMQSTAKHIFLRKYCDVNVCQSQKCLNSGPKHQTPNRRIGRDDKGVTCSKCLARYHTKCAGFKLQDLELLEKHAVHWFCPDCNISLMSL